MKVLSSDIPLACEFLSYLQTIRTEAFEAPKIFVYVLLSNLPTI